ncbi:hypothetical protein CTZ27_14280 [Streptomyces griseocarneus]|nr:hypothetical protein CTZ27_14280 [Streptomyces griseocarneus]
MAASCVEPVAIGCKTIAPTPPARQGHQGHQGPRSAGKEQRGTFRAAQRLEDREPWFVASDVARALGYAHTSSAIRDNVDADDMDTVRLPHGNGRGNPNNPVTAPVGSRPTGAVASPGPGSAAPRPAHDGGSIDIACRKTSRGSHRAFTRCRRG